jgi:peroxiredoxin
MNDKPSRLNAVITAIALILIGFTGGYLARVPIEGWAVRLKASVADTSRQRHLTAQFLGKPAVGIAASKLDGTPFRLSDKKGKVVLMFFWASWCQYSRNALPGIQAIYDRYADRDDFEIVGVSLDRDRDALNDFVRSQNIRWVNLYEDGKAWNSDYAKFHEVKAIPSRWIVGKDQMISGAGLSQAAAEDLLSLLLENKRRTGAAAANAAVPGGVDVEAGGCTAPEAP